MAFGIFSSIGCNGFHVLLNICVSVPPSTILKSLFKLINEAVILWLTLHLRL